MLIFENQTCHDLELQHRKLYSSYFRDVRMYIVDRGSWKVDLLSIGYPRTPLLLWRSKCISPFLEASQSNTCMAKQFKQQFTYTTARYS